MIPQFYKINPVNRGIKYGWYSNIKLNIQLIVKDNEPCFYAILPHLVYNQFALSVLDYELSTHKLMDLSANDWRIF